MKVKFNEHLLQIISVNFVMQLYNRIILPLLFFSPPNYARECNFSRGAVLEYGSNTSTGVVLLAKRVVPIAVPNKTGEQVQPIEGKIDKQKTQV